jgi:magnesium-transporting ATPase (P-type)
MLFAGSHVLQTTLPYKGGPACAIVTDTGANTVEGRQVKDILHPTPIEFVFLEHLKLVFIILILWGIVIMGICFVILGGDSVDSWFYGAFGISKVLTPLLPAVLVIGQSVSAQRLKEIGILCVDLQRITLGGKVEIFAFDKTGILFPHYIRNLD